MEERLNDLLKQIRMLVYDVQLQHERDKSRIRELEMEIEVLKKEGGRG